MYLDIILIFLIFVFALAGYRQGFLRQIISLAALVSIVFLAEPLTVQLKEAVSHPWIVNCPTFVLWIAVSLAILLFAYILNFLVDRFKVRPLLKPVDRWIGLGFGFFKGVIVVLVIGMALQMIPEETLEKFADFESDYEASYFVNAGSEIIRWDLLDHFYQVHRRVKEDPLDRLPSTEPWLWDTDEDRR